VIYLQLVHTKGLIKPKLKLMTVGIGRLLERPL